MLYRRLHANGFEVLIDRDATIHDWWLVHAIAPAPNGEQTPLLGLKTSTAEAARALGNSVATVNHPCKDKCEDWKPVAA